MLALVEMGKGADWPAVEFPDARVHIFLNTSRETVTKCTPIVPYEGSKSRFRATELFKILVRRIPSQRKPPRPPMDGTRQTTQSAP